MPLYITAVINVMVIYSSNRYKSIVCDEDSYFQELMRYIHLNPLRTKLVKDISKLDRYHWSGHSVLNSPRNYDRRE
jgi:putative transposase